ncbi:hypothetical protein SCB71_12325 [Herbiconiux sp. KACC 21604]|uniref:prepilin peptidase n=1 Tax=unclassified Herbiconiux TaxID=2618217 RepID=UPI001490BA46|nr:prepilin peptidase [Herbiconiux sp. SALV-R1]QJU53973.1 hypothetical protein HL652_10275 [Herbiconiux sp. SALV-R1]WPO85001.1 hypothetical protein SCB71_12325 [Herbiconiux sp. KACC 21604]
MLDLSSPTLDWLPLLHLAAATIPLVRADARTLRLPNALTVPGLAVTAAVAFATGDAAAVGMLVAASLVGAVVWQAGCLGLGDVKLLAWLAGASALTDALGPLRVLAAAGAASAVVAAALLGAASGARVGVGGWSRVRVPLGPALLIGFWFGVLLPPAA